MKIGDRIRVKKIDRVGRIIAIEGDVIKIRINPVWEEVIRSSEAYEILPEINRFDKGKVRRKRD